MSAYYRFIFFTFQGPRALCNRLIFFVLPVIIPLSFNQLLTHKAGWANDVLVALHHQTKNTS